MRQTIKCNHYRAMSEHTTCKVGVAYATMQGVPFGRRPCFCEHGEQPPPGCDKAVFPTAEELAADELRMQKRMEDIGKARGAIVAVLGGPWRKGAPGMQGRIDCPVCGKPATLQFTRAGYNGHIHAGCSTEGCVRWME